MNWISTYYYRYAALGFSTIPIKTLAYATGSDRFGEAKRPLCDWKKFQRERPTLEQVASWSKGFPFAGIGLVTGTLSGLYVVDDDRAGRPPLDGARDPETEQVYQILLKRYKTEPKLRAAYAAADAFCEALAALPTAISRTSKGRHYYFTLPKDADGYAITIGNSARFLPGIDTRGEGGYVLAPPSLHPTGTSYIWERPPEDGILELPHWVYEAIRTLPNVGSTVPSSNGGIATHKLGEYQCPVEEGSRNATAAIFIGRLIALDYPNEMDWDTVFRRHVVAWNKQNRPPLPYEELSRTFDSICDAERRRRGSTQREIYSVFEMGGPNEVRSAQQIGLMDLRAPGYAVKDFFVDGTTHLMGKPKSGKSILALQTAVAIATGTPLFPPNVGLYANGNHPQGFATDQGDVLYLALEDSLIRLRDRTRAVMGDLFGTRELPERLQFANAWSNLFDGGLTNIERWITSVPKARLVIIDPLAAFVGEAQGKGNVFRAEYRMFRPIWEMAQRLKVPVLIIDHASKSKGKFGSGDPFDSGAGTLGGQAAVDSVMIMQHDDKKPMARINYKGRDIDRGFLDLEYKRTMLGWSIAPPVIPSEENTTKVEKTA